MVQHTPFCCRNVIDCLLLSVPCVLALSTGPVSALLCLDARSSVWARSPPAAATQISATATWTCLAGRSFNAEADRCWLSDPCAATRQQQFTPGSGDIRSINSSHDTTTTTTTTTTATTAASASQPASHLSFISRSSTKLYQPNHPPPH